MRNAEKRFEAMVNLLSAEIHRYAFWLCRNQTVAEDLVQETFMRAWRAFDSLRDEARAKHWLRTTVRREYARLYQRSEPVHTGIDLDRIPADSGGEDISARALTLRRAVARLPKKYQEPLVLQVVGGYLSKEIAEMLELPDATIRTRLFRARQQLRAAVEDKNSSPAERLKSG